MEYECRRDVHVHVHVHVHVNVHVDVVCAMHGNGDEYLGAITDFCSCIRVF